MEPIITDNLKLCHCEIHKIEYISPKSHPKPNLISHRIISNISRALDNRSFKISEIHLFLGQLLAWCRYSLQEKVPEEICFFGPWVLEKNFQFNQDLITTPNKELVFADITNKIQAVSIIDILRVREFLLIAIKGNQLDFNQLAQTLFNYESPREALTGYIPQELADLCIELLNGHNGDELYCPFANSFKFAQAGLGHGFQVYTEIEDKQPMYAIANMLLDNKLELAFSDPIKNPGWLEKGQLKQFSFGCMLPRIGHRGIIVEDDIFDRFPEKSFFGEVLDIRHLLAQITKRCIVLVPNGLLFRTSAGEREFKANILRSGLLSAVISLPGGLLASTAISTSLLIFDKTTKNNEILFVNATSNKFYISSDNRNISPNRKMLTDTEYLKNIITQRQDSTYSKLININDCETQDFNLTVDRYVLSKDQLDLKTKLAVAQTKELCELAEIIRPQSLRLTMSSIKDEEPCDEFYEVSVSDVNEHGLIKQPSKKININAKMSNQFNEIKLQPNDILLTCKGNIGVVALVNVKPPQNWIASQSFIIIRPKIDKIDPILLFRYLRSPIGQSIIKSRAGGSSILLIQQRDIKSLSIILPSEKQAVKIKQNHQEMLNIQAQIESLQNRLDELNKSNWDSV